MTSPKASASSLQGRKRRQLRLGAGKEEAGRRKRRGAQHRGWPGAGLGRQGCPVPGLVWIWPHWVPLRTHFSSEEIGSKRVGDDLTSAHKCERSGLELKAMSNPSKGICFFHNIFLSHPPPNHPTCTHTQAHTPLHCTSS